MLKFWVLEKRSVYSALKLTINYGENMKKKC